MGYGASSATTPPADKSHTVWDTNDRRQVNSPQTSTGIAPSQPVIVPPVPPVVNTLPPAPIPPASSTPVVQIPVLSQMPTSTVSSASLTPSSNASTPSSTEIIRITALPPVDPASEPTYVTYPKKHPPSQQKFKMIYLVPVFVFLGILWGSLAAWLAYGCLTRRPKVQDDVFIGGPRYVPAPSDVEGWPSLQQDREEMQEATFSWPDLKQAAREPENDENGDEDDPFLLPPTPTKARSARTKSSRSTKTAHSDATYMLETDDEDKKDIPWERLRHKSIKRGILEQVQQEGNRINSLRSAGTVRNTGTGTRKSVERRTSRHGRTDSDVLIGDIDQLLSGAGSKDDRPSTHRADSACTTVSLISRTTTGDKTQWKPGTGFRIVAESPLSSRGPTPAPSDDPVAFHMSSTATTPADRYTPAPARRHTSRSCSTSPVKGSAGPSTPARPHAAILPQSPPQITSPLLENNLCFTPSRRPPPRAFTSPVTTPQKRHDASRKLRSPRSQPLPFPSAHDGVNSPRPDMYRGRLVKSPVKAQRPPITSKSSSSSTTYTRDANGRAVEAAIKKVEDIIERSWGARDLGDRGEKALSPTRFGRPTGH
ncbi:hypothetical protein H0H87_003875 [Tephrocybe sp. NHM501043]|nr:hypothetical protein H0H87_003875 [Tephrocybe sp. NHM501043]